MLLKSQRRVVDMQRRDTPIGMNLPTEDENTLAADEQRILIPIYL